MWRPYLDGKSKAQSGERSSSGIGQHINIGQYTDVTNLSYLYCELLREAVVDEVDAVSGNMPGVDDDSGSVEVPLDELSGVEGTLVSGVDELLASFVDCASVSVE
jgi:hypothetical protein